MHILSKVAEPATLPAEPATLPQRNIAVGIFQGS